MILKLSKRKRKSKVAINDIDFITLAKPVVTKIYIETLKLKSDEIALF
jgi:hypothetical protein